MIGDVRIFDLTSRLAAALDRAGQRLGYAMRGLWATAQVRFNLAGAAPRSALVGAPVIPTVRYRDVPAAVDWLCRAFGMQVHRVVADANGAPRYAELTVGSGMLMVAPIEDTAFGKLMVQPDEIGGVETQVCYLCVGNARAHYARAKAAGAVIVIDPEDEANRGRGYSCRDPEGHVWNFGTYDPWSSLARPVAAPRWSFGRAQQGVAAVVLLALAATMVAELVPQPSARAGTAVVAAHAPAAPPLGAPAGLEAQAPAAAEEPRQEPLPTAVAAAVAPALAPPLAAPAAAPATANVDMPARGEAPTPDHPAISDKAQEHRAALAAAQSAAAEARVQLVAVRDKLAEAAREAGAVRARLAETQRAKLVAERAAAEARGRLAAAQKAAERARAQAARERSRRLAADRAARIRARRPARAGRTRQRTWCYSPYASGQPARDGGRLVGFCRG